MSIYKPGKSRFWHYDLTFKGRRFHGSTGCTSKRDAAQVEAQVRREAALGILAKPPLSLDEAAGAWWQAKGQHLRSAATVRYQLAALIAGIGRTVAIGEITLAMIDAHVARRRARLANASVNREIALLRRVLQWAEARGYDAPAIQWREAKLKEKAVTTRVLSPEEELRLFAALPPSLAPIVEFALLSGQRKAEVIGLRWADVDLGAARASVWAKGQRPHGFPLTPRMVALIASQPRVAPQVFTYEAARDAPARPDRPRRIAGERYPFSVQGWDRQWRRAVKAAGLAGFRFHDLRHTAASRTGRIELAFELLGHSDIRTTKRYFHTAEDDLRRALTEAEARQAGRDPAEVDEAKRAAND